MIGKTNTNAVATINLNSSGKVNGIYAKDFYGEVDSVTINIVKGLVTGENAISSEANCNTILNIQEGSTVDATGIGIYNVKTTNMYDGTITAGTVGIKTNEDSTTVIEKGTITGTTVGIEMDSTSNVLVKEPAKVSATNGPGIKVNNGILTLGENVGGYPNQKNPSIIGTTYGVQNVGGTFNFYDGILKGNTNAIYGTVSETPELFSVIYSADETVATLGIRATFEQIASVNGIYFDSIETAISAAITAELPMEICKNIVLENPIVVPEGKELTIDLQGFYLYGYVEGPMITNNGTLIIIDETNIDGLSASTIKNFAGTAIENNGDLTIGKNDGTIYTNAPIVIGKNTAIDNKSLLTIFDGKFGKMDETGTIITETGTIYAPGGYSIVVVNDYWTLGQN